MTTIAVEGGGSLFVESVGSGPPVLITHGGPGMHHGIYRTLDPLAERARLVFWDHRGHGRSGPLPDSDIDMSLFADDAVSVADALGIDQFAVFGHSFGGWVAQELVLRHPSRVAALVLAATTPGQLGTTESADDDQGPPPPPEVEAAFAKDVVTDDDLIEMYTALAPFFTRGHDPATFIAALDRALVSADSMNRVFAALSRWSAVDRLHEIRCPTLILSGEHDVFCSPQQGDRIARRIPDAEHLRFDTGHFIWFEDPDGFFRCVSTFLDQN